MTIDNAAFTEFANRKVYWWTQVENADIDDVLATILAKHTDSIKEEACRKFGFTDADFIHALRQAPPGLFETREKWEKTTARFGIKLPYPKCTQRDIFIALNRQKQDFEERLRNLDERTAKLIAIAQG